MIGTDEERKVYRKYLAEKIKVEKENLETTLFEALCRGVELETLTETCGLDYNDMYAERDKAHIADCLVSAYIQYMQLHFEPNNTIQ